MTNMGKVHVQKIDKFLYQSTEFRRQFLHADII